MLLFKCNCRYIADISNEFIHRLYLACRVCLLLRVVDICLGHKALGTSIENKAISIHDICKMAMDGYIMSL